MLVFHMVGAVPLIFLLGESQCCNTGITACGSASKLSKPKSPRGGGGVFLDRETVLSGSQHGL